MRHSAWLKDVPEIKFSDVLSITWIRQVSVAESFQAHSVINRNFVPLYFNSLNQALMLFHSFVLKHVGSNTDINSP